MSTDFTDRVPLLRDPQLLQPIRPAQSDQWPMFPTAIASAFAFFLLCSFILFACQRFANTTASPPSAWQHNQHVPAPPPAPVALCPETVAGLPVVRAGAGQKFYSCAVCLAEYEEKERVKLMPVCGHLFHPECIDTWLLSHGSCPICRCSEMSTGRGTEEEVRLNVFEGEGEGGEEEEKHRRRRHRKIGRSRSCSSSMEVELEGTSTTVPMLFLHRSCSFG